MSRRSSAATRWIRSRRRRWTRSAIMARRLPTLWKRTWPAQRRCSLSWRATASRCARSRRSWSRTGCGNSRIPSTSCWARSARRRQAFLDGVRPGIEITPGSPALKAALDAELEAWRKDGCIRRLWTGDKSLWTGADEDQWLGWLDVVAKELAGLEWLSDFQRDVKQRGFSDIVVLGMGGSSLGPEVLGETFGPQAGWPRFNMLDSTDPAQIAAIERNIDVAKTLFIVSSKSGSTLEPNIFMEYFVARVRRSAARTNWANISSR